MCGIVVIPVILPSWILKIVFLNSLVVVTIDSISFPRISSISASTDESFKFICSPTLYPEPEFSTSIEVILSELTWSTSILVLDLSGSERNGYSLNGSFNPRCVTFLLYNPLLTFSSDCSIKIL